MSPPKFTVNWEVVDIDLGGSIVTKLANFSLGTDRHAIPRIAREVSSTFHPAKDTMTRDECADFLACLDLRVRKEFPDMSIVVCTDDEYKGVRVRWRM